MISFRFHSGLSQVYFILLASFALAFVQNVTVDDAVTTGPVVPNYLPNASVWNIGGNNCTTCSARPDHVQAFNGTWHDKVYYPSGGYVPAIEITFTGNGLYIFFIIANTLPGLVKLTDIFFELDNVNASSYIHNPDNTSDYMYNVPVYSNDSLESGPHTMMVMPVLAGNNVEMLFDYFIYSTESTDATTSPSSPSPSESSPSSRGASSVPHVSGIIGGTVGGGIFLLLGATLSCYWIYKRRRQPPTDEGIPLARRAPINTISASPANPFVDPPAQARSASPDYADMMKGINERSKQVHRSRKSQEALS